MMTVSASPSPLQILLVEDNPADSKILIAFLRSVGGLIHPTVVTDGEAAIQYLSGKGEYAAVSVPDLVLLDINLPKKNGFEVLSEIRANARVANLPVYIISSTRNPDDIRRSQALNVAGFFSKPTDLNEFQKLAELLITKEFPKLGSSKSELNKGRVALTEFSGGLSGESGRGKSGKDELFRQLVEAVKDYAILMLDPQGIVLTWNEGAERLKGYRASEIIGKHFSIFYPEEALRIDHPAHELEIAARLGRFQEEGWRVKKDGSTFWANVTITALFDEQGVLQGFAKVTRDITNQKLAEDEKARFADSLEVLVQERTTALEASQRELIQQRDQLLRSNADLEQFAYVASHDLQEPLRSIVVCHQLIELRFGKQISPEMKEYMDLAIESSQRMRGLVDGLLQYGRFGQSVQTETAVDLNRIVADVLSSLKSPITEAGATVEVGPLPALPVDASQIGQVFQNLISNSMKYRGEAAPKIAIQAEQKDSRWIFSLKDNGLGIEPQYFERIFIIFQRLHSNREKYPGTGIGLAICKRVIESHGGKIWLSSEPGQSTTFYFSLPA